MNYVNSMYRTVTERFGNLGSERVHYKFPSLLQNKKSKGIPIVMDFFIVHHMTLAVITE